MEYKSFKTIDEQLDILISRGLKVNNKEKAKKFLLHNNYYRVSGYSLTLRNHDVFFKSAEFQNIVDIYNFDHEIRHIILEYIEIIEVTVKSVYSYIFTKQHGSIGYLNPNFFTNTDKYNDIIQKAEAQKKARLPHEAYLKHYIEDLNQEVPFWAYVDLLTISNISFLYTISETDIKNEVASEFGLTMKKGSQIFAKYMHSMTIIRNLCAHGSRLYNRLFEQKPSLNRKEQALLIKDEQGNIDNSHLYGFILIMRRLLSKDDFEEMKKKIINLTKTYPFVSMHYYGFRCDWKNVL